MQTAEQKSLKLQSKISESVGIKKDNQLEKLDIERKNNIDKKYRT